MSGLLFGFTEISWVPLWVRHEMLPVWWGNVRPMNRPIQYGERLVLGLWEQETEHFVPKGFGRK